MNRLIISKTKFLPVVRLQQFKNDYKLNEDFLMTKFSKEKKDPRYVAH